MSARELPERNGRNRYDVNDKTLKVIDLRNYSEGLTKDYAQYFAVLCKSLIPLGQYDFGLFSFQQVFPNKLYRGIKLKIPILLLSEAVAFVLGQ